jgi:hypothetical protein
MSGLESIPRADVGCTEAATSNSLLLRGTPVALPLRCRSGGPEVKLEAQAQSVPASLLVV